MGKFQVGRQKTGGRKKGVPNKKSEELLESLIRNKIDPIAEISKILPTLPPKDQVSTLLSLLPYVYPKKKAIEFQGDFDGDLKIKSTPVTFDRLKEAIKKDPFIDI